MMVFIARNSGIFEAMNLRDIQTPALLLDTTIMRRNITAMNRQLQGFDITLRPHVKTAKCAEIARLMTDGVPGPITVSTLKEAEQFAACGYHDILYAVGIVPSKLDRIMGMRQAGTNLSIILDNLEAAKAVVDRCSETGESIPVLIEIDSDGHRAGLRPDDPLLFETARLLYEGTADFRGVMTHAGSAYDHAGAVALAAMAEQERSAAVRAAESIRQRGICCPVVSVGSTPTASFVRDLSGVTEVRAGVYVFMDLVMAGLGVCSMDDIAISVLATVIGHQQDRDWILVDAGWMAMSRDRGTASQAVDQGYGIICDMSGRPYDDLIMASANQEHGILSLREGATASLPVLPVGSLVRVLPNHACATASEFSCYHVLDGENLDVSSTWQRFSGW